MINSKNALIKALKNGTVKGFKTIVNEHRPELAGTIRKQGTITQTNAFTIEREKDGKIVDSWIWLNDIDISNNIIVYKQLNIKIEILEI